MAYRDAYREAALSHLAELSQAPHRQLEAFRRAERTMLETLQVSDVRMCGRYVAEGFAPGAQPPRDVRPLLVAMNIAQCRAAAAGRDHPAGRKIGSAVAPADSIALVKAMRDQG